MRSLRTGFGLLFGLILGGITGCGPVASQNISMQFKSQIGHERTRNIAVSVFEPFRQDADTGERLFVKCGDVSAFMPQAKVNPAALSSSGDLGRILRDREDVDFKAGESFDVSFDPELIDGDNNPWGAVIVFVEALGEALSADGGEVPSTTLLSGCQCFRTKGGGSGALDATVRRNCIEIDPDEATPLPLEIGPLSEPAFRLELCEGPASLTAPRNAALSPGPRVCVREDLCSDAGGQSNCFECKQPCVQILDKHGLPIVFTLDPAEELGGDDDNQKIVLTNEGGEATVAFDITECSRPVTIRAQILGRPEYRQDFTVDCVDPPSDYLCDGSELIFGDPIATTVLPLSKMGACNGVVGGKFCDRMLILVSEKDDMNQDRGSFLRMHGSTENLLEFAAERPHGLYAYFYDEAETELVVAVVTGPIDAMNKAANLRLYRWDVEATRPRDALQLVHGPELPGTNLLPRGRCDAFRCGTRKACDTPAPRPSGVAMTSNNPGVPNDACCPVDLGAMSCTNDMTCTMAGVGDICIPDELGERRCARQCDISTTGEQCNTRGECVRNVRPEDECLVTFDPQARAPMRAKDTDGDGNRDLVLAISDKAPVVFFQSGKTRTSSLAMYYDPLNGCECARFGTAVGAFALVDLGGTEPAAPGKTDLVYGSEAGTFVQYARRRRQDIEPYLACGQVPALFEGMAVRDVQSGRLRCGGQAGCPDIDDVVVLSDEGVSSGAIDEAGSLRIIYGGGYNLDDPEMVSERPEVISRVFARTLPGASGAPRDPQAVRLGDFNADSHTDMAVLYRGTSEIHVWFGASNGALGEGARGVNMACDGSNSMCSSLSLFEAVDFDGDGIETFVGFCRDGDDEAVTMRSFKQDFGGGG